MAKLSRKVLIIASVSLAVLLVAGGLTAFFMLKDRGIAAKVNGVKITEEELQIEVSKSIMQYQSQGMAVQPEQMDEIRSSILNTLVVREILKQQSAGYEIDTQTVEDQIASLKGRFESDEAFEEALAQQGYDIGSFRNAIGEDLRIQKLIEGNVPQVTEIDDDSIKTFYDENPAYFTQEERVHASHILVKMDDTFTEEQKAAALDKIKRIAAELAKGADFAETAKAESEGPSAPDGGDLGEFTKGQMVAEFETAAFTLPEGTISGIVKTQFGYHIIKVHEKYPATAIPLEDVSSSISDYLIQDKNQTNLNDYLDGLKEGADIRYPSSKA